MMWETAVPKARTTWQLRRKRLNPNSTTMVSPAAGKGNVFGEIRWNGSGAADLEVLLCADFSSFSGCGGEEFLTTTDENGQYLFEDVVPGVYALSVRVFNSDDWLYISSGILSSAEFEVEAGKTLTIGRQNIFKLDVKLQEPRNGGKVVSAEVLLDWQDYPGADYYKVSLYPDEGDAVLLDKRTNTSSLRRFAACELWVSLER